jgi:hypothetical protein
MLLLMVKKEPVVRTILNINNDDQSMILAGDAPVNLQSTFQ